jgi:hypothetical protein
LVGNPAWNVGTWKAKRTENIKLDLGYVVNVGCGRNWLCVMSTLEGVDISAVETSGSAEEG